MVTIALDVTCPADTTMTLACALDIWERYRAVVPNALLNLQVKDSQILGLHLKARFEWDDPATLENYLLGLYRDLPEAGFVVTSGKAFVPVGDSRLVPREVFGEILPQLLALVLKLEDFSFRVAGRIEMPVETVPDVELSDVVLNGRRLALSRLALLDTPVDEMGFSTRIRNSLRNNQIDRLGFLIVQSRRELLHGDNFGKKSLQEVTDYLHAGGWELDSELRHWRPGQSDTEVVSDRGVMINGEPATDLQVRGLDNGWLISDGLYGYRGDFFKGRWTADGLLDHPAFHQRLATYRLLPGDVVEGWSGVPKQGSNPLSDEQLVVLNRPFKEIITDREIANAVARYDVGKLVGHLAVVSPGTWQYTYQCSAPAVQRLCESLERHGLTPGLHLTGWYPWEETAKTETAKAE